MITSRFHKSFLLVVFLFLSNFHLNASDAERWSVLKSSNENNVTLNLKMISIPDFTDLEWISFEIENNDEEPLVLLASSLRVDFHILNADHKMSLPQSSFHSTDPYLFSDALSPLPLSEAVLNKGTNKCAIPLSVYGSAFLGASSKDLEVSMKISADFEFKGRENFKITWEEKDIKFIWSKIDDRDNEKLLKEVRMLMRMPTDDVHLNKKMELLLYQPAVSNQITIDELIGAIEIRDKFQGRNILLHFTNQYFPNDSKLIQYFLTQLKSQNSETIESLIISNNTWDKRFLEPTISMFQKSNLGQSFIIIDLLYLHQSKWIKDENIPTILSDLIIYRFEDIIYEKPEDLSISELTSWSSAAIMLGKTGNKEMAQLLCPFLQCEIKVADNDLVEVKKDSAPPRPIRVCDNALEAMIRLTKKTPNNLYAKHGFDINAKPELKQMNIQMIRDKLIKNYSNKCK